MGCPTHDSIGVRFVRTISLGQGIRASLISDTGQLRRSAEDTHCAFVGMSHRVVHEHIGSRMINAKLENRSVAWSYFEALKVMKGVRGIAASINGTEDRPHYVKVGEQVRTDINKENPYQLSDCDRNWVV